MIVAAVGDTAYNIVLLLHVLSAFVALSPMFVYPLMPGQMRPIIMPEQQRLLITMIVNTRSLHGPALLITGLLGFALSGLSEKAHSISESWIIVAIVIWIAMNGVLHAMILPALKSMGAGHIDATTSAHVITTASEHSEVSVTQPLVASTSSRLKKSDSERVLTEAAKGLDDTEAAYLKTSVDDYEAKTSGSKPFVGKHIKRHVVARANVAVSADKDADKRVTQNLVASSVNQEMNKKETERVLSSTAKSLMKAEMGKAIKSASEHPGRLATHYLDTSTAEHLDKKDSEQLVLSATKSLQRGSASMTLLVVVELWLMIWQPTFFTF